MNGAKKLVKDNLRMMRRLRGRTSDQAAVYTGISKGLLDDVILVPQSKSNYFLSFRPPLTHL
ncbi:hypothetical protein KR50_15170 [Jeotgalibacillus campisalis]|uniref:Uncharacterized protein n=1 Tax=Jeotgalibacillus campisalis TaxID=220754 RepID=A0A0C2RAK8_9BACL|nr:hypothetical protein KR50_15170 [Jeotgalibacillus campisalis]